MIRHWLWMNLTRRLPSRFYYPLLHVFWPSTKGYVPLSVRYPDFARCHCGHVEGLHVGRVCGFHDCACTNFAVHKPYLPKS